MVRIGVIGFGYWGPNIVRNFKAAEGSDVVAVCDLNEQSLKRVKNNYPGIHVTNNFDELLLSPDIDAIAVITPVSTHYDLAKKALLNGKHIFVEKPFTATVSQAEELIEIASRKDLVIMVDHTFLFTGAVKRMKKIIDDNILGEVYYYDSMRVNLGLFQHDVNVIWDLAPHDLSIMNYLIDSQPIAVSANGKAHFGNSKEDVAYITVYFANNIIAHFNINWLSPVKVRKTLIGGEKKMLVWDELNADDKIKVYDRGVDVKTKEGVYDLLVSYRSGDMWSPRVDQTEALMLEANHFVDCIETGERPLNDAYSGLDVVKILEACDQSIKNNGKQIGVGESYKKVAFL